MSQATCPCVPPGACTPGRGRPTTLVSGLQAAHPATWLAAILDRLAAPWRRRTAIRDLHRLGDSDLRDIGIERGEIDSIVDDLMDRRLRTRQRR